MKVRAITAGCNLGSPLDMAAFARVADLCKRAKEEIERRGIEVQTLRVAGGRLNGVLAKAGAVVALAQQLDSACRKEGIDVASVGCVDATIRGVPDAFAPEIAAAVAKTESIFASVLAARGGQQINKIALMECARAVLLISRATPDGFSTRRFALGANVPPDGPFFPTSYHDGGPPAFSFALEAADLAVKAFTKDAATETACNNLVAALEEQCLPLEEAGRALEARHGVRYEGIDLSPAPFPSPEVSIAGAAESLGGGTFGSSGTLSAVRAITNALRRVKVKKCGFSGVMLPVLEDSVLMSRVAEGKVTVDQLLFFSAVCGTGLDTIPLPGDISEEQLAAIMLDVCTLSLALDKPLTARLMPVPGKSASDWTEFQSPYFGNTRIMSLPPECMRKLTA